ncbi:trihelix transcription factor GT-3b-like [Iris pallida]|uniref:Trihelix transcription factor GT-3b-like n=1 Tax=Iris pallida TaxID=29817 RepID=A0AAX6H1D3_IRIPA|nr:trihelix transcription factor GT-3b-like [Iris pallida]
MAKRNHPRILALLVAFCSSLPISVQPVFIRSPTPTGLPRRISSHHPMDPSKDVDQR